MEQLHLKLAITTVDTNMTTLFEQYKVLKDTAYKAESELGNFIHLHKKDLLKTVVDELKTVEGFNKLIIKGYTPGFNDGDACTHSSEPYYSCTQRSKWNDFSELSEYGIGIAYFLTDGEIEEDEELRDWDGFDIINTYSVEDNEKVDYLVSQIDYLIEEIYHTDYIVYIDLTGDEPKIDHEYYDCGH